jgi:hypothetical protein
MDRKEAVKRIKAGLKAKTGKTWSVTGGRGTAWGWLRIQAPKSRRVSHEVNPEHDGFERTDRFMLRTGSTPWIEYVSDDGDDWYTSDADVAELKEIFEPGYSHFHQGLQVQPDEWERFVALAEA